MSKERDIEDLLKNIQQGLKKYTIKELNEALAKTEPKGKKRAKIMQELNRKINE